MPKSQVHLQEKANFEDLLKKARTLRERMSHAQGEVKGGRQDRAYIWINRNDSRIQYFEGLGYTICRDPNVRTKWKKEDGEHRWGDVILMEVDKDFKEALEVDSDAKSVEALTGSRQEFIEFAIQNRIPVQDRSKTEEEE